MQASTCFTTENAERYLGTLCKHFGPKVPVEIAAGSGRIEFPFGQCVMHADDSGLSLVALAGDRPQLDRTVRMISSHLERFAFRESPNLKWAYAA